MKQRPILFSAPMIHAILEGRKTMTRRRIKNDTKCPYGQIGDVLWVKETYRRCFFVDEDCYIDFNKEIIEYRADNPEPRYLVDGNGSVITNKDGSEKFVQWKPSIFMPKYACRIFLEITDIGVERLQDISQEDARDEGVFAMPHRPSSEGCKPYIKANLTGDCFVCAFKTLWNRINGKKGYTWEANPMVWIISFKKINKPENF